MPRCLSSVNVWALLLSAAAIVAMFRFKVGMVTNPGRDLRGRDRPLPRGGDLMSTFAPQALLAAALMVAPCLARAETVTFAQAPSRIAAQRSSRPRSQETGGRALGRRAATTDAQSGRALGAAHARPDRLPLPARNLPTRCRARCRSERPVQAVYGKVDQAGGVRSGLIDPNNYYVARANALEDNVRFYRVVAGKREQIASADTRVTPGEWHTLDAPGRRATASRSPSTAASSSAARDRTFGGEGRVALWTKADSITRFDRLEIKPLGE